MNTTVMNTSNEQSIQLSFSFEGETDSDPIVKNNVGSEHLQTKSRSATELKARCVWVTPDSIET